MPHYPQLQEKLRALRAAVETEQYSESESSRATLKSLNAVQNQPDCFHGDYNIPKGSYVEHMEKYCGDKETELSQCIKNIIVYDSDTDTLSLTGFTSYLIENDSTRYPFPVVLPSACSYVAKGYDITLSDVPMLNVDDEYPDKDVTTPFNTLLLLPPKPSRNILWNLAWKDYRVQAISGKFAPQLTLLKEQCSNTAPLTFGTGITTTCTDEQGSHQLSLSNGMICLEQALDIVRVGNGLYCFDFPATLSTEAGMIAAKAGNNRMVAEHYVISDHLKLAGSRKKKALRYQNDYISKASVYQAEMPKPPVSSSSEEDLDVEF